jgi:hypothetical protein
MRVEQLGWLVVLGGCVNGAPWGFEPAPKDENDDYVGTVVAPDCRPNNDGIITRNEMPFVVGVPARVRVAEGPVAVNVDGFVEDGVRRWDLSTPLPESQPLSQLVLQNMDTQWYADRFVGAQYAGPLNPGGTLRGALTVDEAGVHLWGSASQEENPTEGRTLLVYDAPVTLYPFPLQEGARVTKTVRASNAQLVGLTTALDDTYDVQVTARGTLVLPDLILENTLRVTLRLHRVLVAGNADQVTHVFVHECMGEVARMVGPAVTTGSAPDDFPMAQQVWRTSL